MTLQTDQFYVYRSDSGTVVADGAAKTFRDEDFATVVRQVVDELPAAGGEIHVRSGAYRVERPIKLTKPVALRGVRAGHKEQDLDKTMTALVAAPDLEGPVLHVTGREARDGMMWGTEITDLTVVGNADTNAGTDCIRFEEQEGADIRNLSIERLVLDSAARHGISFAEVNKQVQVRDVWIGHCLGNAFDLDSGTRYWLTNCYGYLSNYGLRVADAVEAVTVTAVHVRQNQRAGIVFRSPFFQLLGGRVIDNNGHGIDAAGGRGLVFGAEIANNSGDGVVLGSDAERDTSHVRVLGNYVGNTALKTEQSGTPQGHGPLGAVRAFRETLDSYGLRETLFRTTRYVGSFGDGGAGRQGVGVVVEPGVTETVVSDNTFDGNDERAIADEGVRTLVDGTGTNDGTPTEGGEWHGHGREGLTVWNVTDDTLHRYVRGTWRRLS